MGKKLLGSILLLTCFIIAISGCTDNTQQNGIVNGTFSNGNFSNGVISFEYPSDFQNVTKPEPIISGAKNWQTLGYLSNNKEINILLQEQAGSISPENSIASTQDAFRKNNGTVLSTTDENNPNGVEVSGDISTLTDPKDNTLKRYYYMIFQANGQTYVIRVSGPDSENTNILKVKNIIYNSLKVS